MSGLWEMMSSPSFPLIANPNFMVPCLNGVPREGWDVRSLTRMNEADFARWDVPIHVLFPPKTSGKEHARLPIEEGKGMGKKRNRDSFDNEGHEDESISMPTKRARYFSESTEQENGPSMSRNQPQHSFQGQDGQALLMPASSGSEEHRAQPASTAQRQNRDVFGPEGQEAALSRPRQQPQLSLEDPVQENGQAYMGNKRSRSDFELEDNEPPPDAKRIRLSEDTPAADTRSIDSLFEDAPAAYTASVDNLSGDTPAADTAQIDNLSEDTPAPNTGFVDDVFNIPLVSRLEGNQPIDNQSINNGGLNNNPVDNQSVDGTGVAQGEGGVLGQDHAGDDMPDDEDHDEEDNTGTKPWQRELTIVQNETRWTQAWGLEVCLAEEDWVPAIYHHDHVASLPFQTIDPAQYVYKRAMDSGVFNFTAFLESQRTWGEEREDRPDILFVYKMSKRRWQGSDPSVLQSYGNDGVMRVVLDPINNRPLRDFANLPITISKKVEGWLMEAWQRQDRTIRIEDIIQRMPFTATDDVWSNKKFRNALTQRKDRFRNRGRCLCWEIVSHGGKWNLKLQEDMNAHPDWLKANTTRHLSDLTVKEEKALGAATFLSGKHQSKAGKRALQGQAKVDKEDKLKKLLHNFEEDAGAAIVGEEVVCEPKRTRARRNRQRAKPQVAQQLTATDGQADDDTTQGQGEFVLLSLANPGDLSSELLGTSYPPPAMTQATSYPHPAVTQTTGYPPPAVTQTPDYPPPATTQTVEDRVVEFIGQFLANNSPSSKPAPASSDPVPISSYPLPRCLRQPPMSSHPPPEASPPASSSSHPAPASSHQPPEASHPAPISSYPLPRCLRQPPEASYLALSSSHPPPEASHPAPVSPYPLPWTPLPRPQSPPPNPAPMAAPTAPSSDGAIQVPQSHDASPGQSATRGSSDATQRPDPDVESSQQGGQTGADANIVELDHQQREPNPPVGDVQDPSPR